MLQGVFHERIEYPNVNLKRAQRHSQQLSEQAAARAKEAAQSAQTAQSATATQPAQKTEDKA